MLDLYQTVDDLNAGDEFIVTVQAALPEGGASTTMGVYWGGEEVGQITPSSTTLETFEYTVTARAGDGSDALRLRTSDYATFDNAEVGDVTIEQVGDDTLSGGDGDDRLFGDLGADVIQGGDGVDEAVYSNSDETISLNLAANTGSGGHAEGDSWFDFERIIGSTFGDTLTGEGNDDRLNSEGGDNSIDGGAGDDIKSGGSGADSLTGGEGDDSFYDGDGDDVISGGEGQDRMYSGAGADDYDGGDDVDTLSYINASAAVSLHMADGGLTGDAAGDSYANIEQLIASNFDDDVTGTGNADKIYGEDGNDTISAGDADDFIDGGNGADSLSGDAGKDNIDGGDGDDTMLGGADNDKLIGGGGENVIDGGDCVDLVDYTNFTGAVTVNLDTNINTGAWADGETITSIERVFGSDGFGDSITGSDDYDKLYGLSGDDTMDGGNGRDFVGGGVGTDNLSGGADNDILLGDACADTLSGGEGADQLTGAAGDDSLDGGASNDRIISGLGADTIEGGDDIDTLILNEASASLDINLVNGTADAIVFANVKRVYATAHDDTITGACLMTGCTA